MTLFIRATSPDEWEQLKRIIVVVITILIVVLVLVVVVYIQCSLDKILYDIGST
jgi:flagellar basal body-associated protein FliL